MLYEYGVEEEAGAARPANAWSNVERLAEANEDVVLDLSRVHFIDSHGLGAVVALLRRLRSKGLNLKVAGLHGQPLNIFLTLNLIPILSVPDDRS